MRDDMIREVLGLHSKIEVSIESIARDANLYDLGMTSHATVSVMLGLEDVFGVEFPDRLLNGETFESIATIDAALTQLGG
ncbi:acyl carrier protein [Smaragdicoccus niigatensis]|uniref:acyl carrier protein n=1 Tax=Smaragdicoccus niigatensis TaxID=359359 RepID=UPI0003614D90|nr:acyl carrier protein [Smaragdicoccus niigatensis]